MITIMVKVLQLLIVEQYSKYLGVLNKPFTKDFEISKSVNTSLKFVRQVVQKNEEIIKYSIIRITHENNEIF